LYLLLFDCCALLGDAAWYAPKGEAVEKIGRLRLALEAFSKIFCSIIDKLKLRNRQRKEIERFKIDKRFDVKSKFHIAG